MNEAATPPQDGAVRRAEPFPAFSLSGGPLHRIGGWLGLVRGDNIAPLGFVLGWLPWFVLVILAFLHGDLAKLMSLSVLGGHVRLLIVIPLLFICEGAVNKDAREFVALLVRTGVAPPTALPGLQTEIRTIRRWADSWVPDVTSLLAAALFTYFAAQMHLAGKTTAMDPTKLLSDAPLAALWYWLVCLPLVRFLLFRWIWRFALWWRFLFRLARTDLHLVPTHPDGVAGLGYLEVVQMRFAPLALALSVIAAASFAEDISTGKEMFEVVYPEMAIAILFSLTLILIPPCVFAFKLRDCQEKGLRGYMELGSRYVSAFEGKWIRDSASGVEPLLGSADFSALADLGTSFATVRNMRMAPVSMRLFAATLGASMLPMLPVFLFKYPLAEILKKVFMKLTGL